MAEVYFVVVALEYWALMAVVDVVDVAVTLAVITFLVTLEQSVMILSILLGFRVWISSS